MARASKNILEIFCQIATSHPQQVAVELDEQTWTYSELMTNVMSIARHLHIDIGEIVFQYVDRSFEMVCGILAIMYAGGVYCPLSPTDPSIHVQTLIDRIHGRYVLVHRKTRNKFLNTITNQIQLIDLEYALLDDTIQEATEQCNYFSYKMFLKLHDSFSFQGCVLKMMIQLLFLFHLGQQESPKLFFTHIDLL